MSVPNRATLTDLPPEVLEQIYHYLASIDDVHHLGRACKKTQHVLIRQSVYTKIMRSVIQHSPYHRYDYQLHKMLKLHQKIVTHFETKTAQLATSQHYPLVPLNEWETSLVEATEPHTCQSDVCFECFPDGAVYDILARYQGVRVLEDMWLERQLNEGDFLSTDDTPDAQRLTRKFEYLIEREEDFKDGDIPARCAKDPNNASYAEFNMDQRGRFYAAITCVWLLNEIRWVLTNFAYPTPFNVQITLLDQCKQNLAKVDHTPLLDELDRYAVFVFMYHHLLPLYGSFLADRDSSKLPLTFASDFTKDYAHCARLLQLFLTAGQTYLHPPSLIDLITRSKTSRQRPYPRLPLPLSTEKWLHPSPNYAFPPSLSLVDPHYKNTFQRASITHLSLITRSSFHQTPHIATHTQGGIRAPALGQALFVVPDWAKRWFTDRVVLAFEMFEVRDSRAGDMRKGFPEMWGVGWGVWWWAGGEDKARAKMERWRREGRG